MYMYLLPTFDSFKKFFTESWKNATIIALPHDTGKKLHKILKFCCTLKC